MDLFIINASGQNQPQKIDFRALFRTISTT